MRCTTYVFCAMSVALLSNARPFNDTLVERESPIMTCYTTHQYTQLVGDGNPHRDDLKIQLSDTLVCNQDESCSASATETTTVSWSFDAGVAVGAPGFTDGEGSVGLTLGFSVSESQSVGTTNTCPGPPGANTCVWTNIPHAAYTVVNVVENSCGTSTTSTPYVERAPGTPGYYCVEYTCSSRGDQYWVYDVQK